MKDERAHLQLFDLIARDWVLPSPAGQIVFNAADSAVAFACADGSIHIAATADKASPDSRIRRAVDTGRLTIAPRSGPFPPLKTADYTEGRTTSVVPHGPLNFAFARSTGRVNTLTPGGTAVYLPPRAPGPIGAIAATPDGDTLAFSCGAEVQVAAPTGLRTLHAASPVTAMAFSPDGTSLAVAHATGLTRWQMAVAEAAGVTTDMVSAPISVSWRADGRWLACCLQGDGFCVIDAATNEARLHASFPAPVRFAAFSDPTDTVVASGAFRVAAWSLDAEDRDVPSGKAGLVLIDAIAASPTRNLVAAGYANGLLSLAEIGSRAEILLREDTGAGISAMAWSRGGAYLALAGADGTAALVEFPDSMFKS